MAIKALALEDAQDRASCSGDIGDLGAGGRDAQAYFRQRFRARTELSQPRGLVMTGELARWTTRNLAARRPKERACSSGGVRQTTSLPLRIEDYTLRHYGCGEGSCFPGRRRAVARSASALPAIHAQRNCKTAPLELTPASFKCPWLVEVRNAGFSWSWTSFHSLQAGQVPSSAVCSRNGRPKAC